MFFPAFLIVLIVLYYCGYSGAAKTLAMGQLRSEKGLSERTGFSFARKRFPMERKDVVPLLVLLAVYSVAAFWGLGQRAAPETYFEAGPVRDSCVIDLGSEHWISSISYFSEINTGSYRIEGSRDSEHWSSIVVLEQPYDEVLKWHIKELDGAPFLVRYIRIYSNRGAPRMGELAVFDRDGAMVRPISSTVLTDEQEMVPEAATYLNGAYFDEIYHVRTALEFRYKFPVYETSHPPLGKLIILIGMLLFGENPFGWRFMGTLIGVVMLFPLYVLLKNLFGKTWIAVCGTALFAFDFMHFVQTRIATIDSYAVFFVICAYLFFFRWLTRGPDELKQAKSQLFLSGLFFGLGAASKWTVVFGGTGLAVLFIADIILRRKNVKREEAVPYYAGLLSMGALFFVVIPAVIYCLSYIPFAACSGVDGGWKMVFSGDFYKVIIKNQQFMFSYHSDLVSDHPYASKWWEWIFNIRPILYWLEYYGGTKSAFGAWGNPLVSWAGLAALAAMVYNLVRRKDPAALFIIVGYLAQLVPWMFVSRETFAYHYFPATVFLVLAIACTFRDLVRFRQKGGTIVMAVFTALGIGLFALFYPVMTGVVVSRNFCLDFLKWFPSWPFG
ncbi:MAG: phospholipid carrier-dependent glycosyltransferase [Clostridiales bacterium]|nr:phospholipid carrier-dependent glycosyltransferase [Clostridiales bacterium]